MRSGWSTPGSIREQASLGLTVRSSAPLRLSAAELPPPGGAGDEGTVRLDDERVDVEGARRRRLRLDADRLLRERVDDDVGARRLDQQGRGLGPGEADRLADAGEAVVPGPRRGRG